MATGVLVPLAEYLGHTYHPDCEYLEGVLVERKVGEVNHSDVQTGLSAHVRTRMRGFWCGVEVRVQVKTERFGVPDVTILRGIPCVWVIDPESRRASIHTSTGTREGKDGMLRNVAGDLAVPLAALFAN